MYLIYVVSDACYYCSIGSFGISIVHRHGIFLVWCTVLVTSLLVSIGVYIKALWHIYLPTVHNIQTEAMALVGIGTWQYFDIVLIRCLPRLLASW